MKLRSKIRKVFGFPKCPKNLRFLNQEKRRRKLPKLEVNLLIAKLQAIEDCLKEENFKTARFLLRDFQFDLDRIDKCLENWEKLKNAKI